MTTAVAFGAGLSAGIVAMMVALVFGRRKMPGPIPVMCGKCLEEKRTGPRRQLYLELWDTYGMQYTHWPVGDGELKNSRPVDGTLLAEIKGEVARVGALQRAAGLGAS